MQKGQGIYKITKAIREIRGCYVEEHGDTWGVQRRYMGVEGICRRVQGYMGVQRRYKGVGGYVEGYGDIWEYKDDTRE